ncbi:DUF262 domain-containing protein [Planococcus maritimus]|nr:DUF262 domain-containing protein [Planococcus sp. SK3692]MDE4084543.1 DUF262 domain-containing protein [Planococcus maritimus]
MFEIERTTATIEEWFINMKNEQINFNPPYQRVSTVWNVQNKQLLIDSIFNRFDMPKFYVHYFFENNNRLNFTGQKYAIIDGKQRFKAIFEFMEDDFKLNNNFIYIENEDIKISGMYYSEIVNNYPWLKHEFESYVIDISLVITEEKEIIEELFLRLNEGKQLNNAERRNSITGFYTSQIREIVSEQDFFQEKVAFQDKRYDYFDVCTKMLLLSVSEEITSLSKKKLDDLLKENRDPNQNNMADIGRFKNELIDFSGIFLSKDHLLGSKSHVPVYFLFYKKFIEEDKQNLRLFFEDFERIKIENRISNKEKSPVLLEYDRLNQQGTISKKSLEDRIEILTLYFLEFNTFKKLSLKTEIRIENTNLDIEELED